MGSRRRKEWTVEPDAPPGDNPEVRMLPKRLMILGLIIFICSLGFGLLIFGISVLVMYSEQHQVVTDLGEEWQTLGSFCLPTMNHALTTLTALVQTLDTQGTLNNTTWNSTVLGGVWAAASMEVDGMRKCGVNALLLSLPNQFGNVTIQYWAGSSVTSHAMYPSGFGLAEEAPIGSGEYVPIVQNVWNFDPEAERTAQGVLASNEFADAENAFVMAANVSVSTGTGFLGLFIPPSIAQPSGRNAAELPAFSPHSSGASLVPNSAVSDPQWVLSTSSTSSSKGASGSKELATSTTNAQAEAKVFTVATSVSRVDTLTLALRPATNGGAWYTMDSPVITIILLCALVLTIVVVSILVVRADYSRSARAYADPPVLAPLGILFATVRADKNLWATWPQEMSETLHRFEKIVRETVADNEAEYSLSIISQNGSCFAAVAGSPNEIMSAAEDLNAAMSRAHWPSQIAQRNELPVRFVCNFSSDVEVSFDSRRNAYDYKGKGIVQTRQFLLGCNNTNRILLTEDFHSSLMLTQNSPSRAVRMEQNVPGLGKVKYYYLGNVPRSAQDSATEDPFDNPMAEMAEVIPKGGRVNANSKPKVADSDMLLLEKIYREWKTPTDPPISNTNVNHSLKNAFIAYRMLLDPFPTKKREELIRAMSAQFGLPHNSVLHRLAVHATMVGGIYQEGK